jgi:hypothetical protein
VSGAGQQDKVNDRDDAQKLYQELLALQPIVEEIGRLRGKEIKELLEDIDELMSKDSMLRDQKDQVRLDFSGFYFSLFFRICEDRWPIIMPHGTVSNVGIAIVFDMQPFFLI